MSNRVSAADSAWFAVDHPSNPMVVTGVIQLTGGLGLSELQELVRVRMVERYPQFSRVVRGRGFLARWRGCAPDISQHVLAAPPGDLAQLVSALMSQALPTGRPPWLMQLITGSDGRATIVARVHH
ncbi:MAG: wax ester/triacylglycerol synthase domain-containing protein, partial [Angustibacter sp.]